MLENCIAKAKELNIQSGLITFDPDPWRIFFPDRVCRHITTLEDRIHLASVMGIEVMYVITFSKNLWIERDDFMEDAPKKFFRMTPGKEVRLKNAYIVKCTGCTKDENGNVIEIQAEYDPISKSGMEGATAR